MGGNAAISKGGSAHGGDAKPRVGFPKGLILSLSKDELVEG
jgi:hypothetical protein